MIRLILLLSLFMWMQVSYAEPVKPVSVSYQQVTRCYPELADESLSFKVDLNRLKDVIDQKFITSRSELRQRKVQYLDADNHLMNLVLRMSPPKGKSKKVDTELVLQRVDDKGVLTDYKLTENQRINPKQEIINGFLANTTIKSDQSSYLDTKLKGVVSTYRRNFRDVEEIELHDKPHGRSLICEKQSDLGIICTCSKK